MKIGSNVVGFAALLTLASSAHSVVTWGFDPINSSVTLQGDTMADNGANLFGPGNNDVDTDTQIAYGPAGPNTVEAILVNPLVSRDAGLAPVFTTTASAAANARLENLNSDTITYIFNAVNLNDTFAGDGFLTRSTATGTSSVRLNFDNLVGATGVRVDYSWSYDAISNPVHESGAEDPELSAGSLSIVSSGGSGPGLAFAALNPGPFTITDSDSGSWTETVSPGDFVTITIDMLADTTMDSLGTGVFQEDLAGAGFRGTLTLSVTVPEPTSLAFLVTGAMLTLRRKR